MAHEEKSVSRINLAILIPASVAVVGALLSFMASVYVGYLNNQATLEVEQKKEKAESELEQQKFKTSLILEAVKVGDKQKALDNLTFFIDAGFLVDPGGKIKSLLNKNVLPVLPNARREAYSYDDYSYDGGKPKEPSKNSTSIVSLPDEKSVRLEPTEPQKTALDMIKHGDELASQGNISGALYAYKQVLSFLKLTTAYAHSSDIDATQKKIDDLETKH